MGRKIADVLRAPGGAADLSTIDTRATPGFEGTKADAEALLPEGMLIVKCFLHISPEEQRERLLARLDDPTKHWKYNPADLEDRARWSEFMRAYGDAFERCSTGVAPRYVVPAGRKWYATGRWALLLSGGA